VACSQLRFVFVLLFTGAVAAAPRSHEPAEPLDAASPAELFVEEVDASIAERNWGALSARFSEDLVLVVGRADETRRLTWTRERLLQAYRRDTAREGYTRTRKVCGARGLEHGRLEVTSAVVERSLTDGQAVAIVLAMEILEIEERLPGWVAISGSILVFALDRAHDAAKEKELAAGGLELLCRGWQESAG
jgi:hypothetical protein